MLKIMELLLLFQNVTKNYGTIYWCSLLCFHRLILHCICFLQNREGFECPTRSGFLHLSTLAATTATSLRQRFSLYNFTGFLNFTIVGRNFSSWTLIIIICRGWGNNVLSQHTYIKIKISQGTLGVVSNYTILFIFHSLGSMGLLEFYDSVISSLVSVI